MDILVSRLFPMPIHALEAVACVILLTWVIVDHCLEILLRSAKCRPDLTIGGLYWEDEVGDVKVHRKARTQKCVKWEGIESWLEPRLLHRKSGVLEGLKSPEGIVRHNPASNE